jgi:hypothetical protein
MDFNRLMKIFKAPKDYWNEMIAEPGDIKSLLVPQMLILAAIPAVATFLGMVFQFLSIGLGGRIIGAALASMVLGYGLQIGYWILMGVIINAFAGTFGAQKDFGQAMKLATGTVIPAWLGSALHIIPVPFLGTLGSLAGLGYGIYLLYLGLPIMNGTPTEKAGGYAAVVVIIMIVIMVILGMIAACPTSCLMTSAVLSG